MHPPRSARSRCPIGLGGGWVDYAGVMEPWPVPDNDREGTVPKPMNTISENNTNILKFRRRIPISFQ